jgi:outer membrane receptor for ferrienterochelin and colicin
MKDHEFREQVNELKELVLKFKDTQQLRSRLTTFLSDFKKKVEETK